MPPDAIGDRRARALGPRQQAVAAPRARAPAAWAEPSEVLVAVAACSRPFACPKVYLPDWPEVVTPHVLRHFCASQLPGRHDGHTSAVTLRGMNSGRRYVSRNGGRYVSD